MPSELSQTLNGSYIMVSVLKVNRSSKPNFQLDCMARPPHRAARFGERNKRQGHAARHGALSPVLRHPILSARPLLRHVLPFVSTAPRMHTPRERRETHTPTSATVRPGKRIHLLRISLCRIWPHASTCQQHARAVRHAWFDSPA